jgi:hypothetical protein
MPSLYLPERTVAVSGINGNGDGGGMIHKTAWDAAAPAIHVRFRCEVVSTTREGVLDQLTEILGHEGYFVSKKITWEKTGEFRKRMNLNHEALVNALESPVCPPVELHRGKGREGAKGQLLAISSNPVFEAFVVALRGKTPTRAPAGHAKPRRTPSVAEGRPSRRKPADKLQRARMRGPKRNYT